MTQCLPSWPVRCWEIAAVAMLLASGIAARTHQSDYNFDGDELFSAELASRSFPEVISQSLEDRPHPPLYNLVLHFWVNGFGASERSTRLLSVLFSAAFLFVTYALCRRVTNPRIALGSLALLAVSPFFVYYGQQARPYALIGLLAAANMLAFVLLLEVPNSYRRRLLWTACSVLLLYSQYLGGLLIALEIAFAVCRLSVNRLKITLSGLGTIALIVPWFIASWYQPLVHGGDPLSHIAWMTRPHLADVFWFYSSVFGSIPGVPTRWLAGLLAGVGLWYLYSIVRARKLGLAESFLLVVASVMPMVVYAVSMVGPKPIFESRQMIAAATAIIALLGLCASRLKKGWDVLFFLILIAWTGAGLPGAFPQASKPPWRQVADDLNERYVTEDIVVAEPFVQYPLRYYRSGRVRLWDELRDVEKGQRFLLLSRPFLELPPGFERSKFRLVTLKTYRWGRPPASSPFRELNLYEVVPLGED